MNRMQTVDWSPTRREWTVALVVALVAVALTLVPYALGYAFTRPGLVYTGLVMNPEDSQSYFAKMLQGYDGRWLYTIPFTTEEHAPAFIGGFYLALGQIARALGLSLDAMWHSARVIADLFMFLATFGFIASFLREPRARWTAYVLAVFGSGLGWLLFLVNQPYWLDAFPVDFKMPEAHLFFTALTFPHVALGTSLIIMSLWLTRRTTETGNWGFVIIAGLVNLALGIVYPFLIYLIAVAVAFFWLYLSFRSRSILWRQGIMLATGLLFPAPLLFEYARTLATSPIFRAWDAQAVTLSPPWPHYLVAYGVMLALAGLHLWIKRQSEFALLWIWLLAAALLVYAPLNPQRRFVQGVQVPLAILATAGLFEVVLPWLGRTRAFRWLAARPRYSVAGLERLLVVLFLMVMGLSNLYILTSLSVTMAIQQPDLLFRPRTEVAAVEWLRANTTRGDVVLSDYETGNYVAAHAGNAVVVGHWAETLDVEDKRVQVARVYNSATDNSVRRDLLARFRVRYVWFGARERAQDAFDPSTATYLTRVFANEGVTVYQVGESK
ncbi:MAG: hypothetical protein HY782_24000 [Chloroflexi bacterium]|nr:hypothetical protein [Chloroflexota bacterium]